MSLISYAKNQRMENFITVLQCKGNNIHVHDMYTVLKVLIICYSVCIVSLCWVSDLKKSSEGSRAIPPPPSNSHTVREREKRIGK